MNDRLRHRTTYIDKEKFAVRIPLTEDLTAIHDEGYFSLIEDPLGSKRTSIIGMFVLRPDRNAWKTHINEHASMRDVKNWTYNVKGADGGRLIAGRNVMDAYRLALQYALADAVLVGSTTVSAEGITTDKKQGYIWHPNNPASWSHLAEADPDIFEKVMAQRRQLQRQGYLSLERKYPAQIVITQSGEARIGQDILAARVFHDLDVDGNPIEAYILTSKAGAELLRKRAGSFGLEDRIDKILIVLSPERDPKVIDLQNLPKVLYDSHNIRIANHDGGQKVLSEFSKAGILPQMNLTLGKKHSVFELLGKADWIDESERKLIQGEFDQRTSRFFSAQDGKIPSELVPAEVIVDNPNEAAVVVFDARKLRGL